MKIVMTKSVVFDRKIRREGDKMEVSPRHGASLVERGLARPAEEAAEKKAPPPPPPPPAGGEGDPPPPPDGGEGEKRQDAASTAKKGGKGKS